MHMLDNIIAAGIAAGIASAAGSGGMKHKSLVTEGRVQHGVKYELSDR
jgi:hypothetical protein